MARKCFEYISHFGNRNGGHAKQIKLHSKVYTVPNEAITSQLRHMKIEGKLCLKKCKWAVSWIELQIEFINVNVYAILYKSRGKGLYLSWDDNAS